MVRDSNKKHQHGLQVTHALHEVKCTLRTVMGRSNPTGEDSFRMYTLAVLSGPFFAKPTAAGKAACVLYTCVAEADCRALWDVTDNNLTGTFQVD